nr:DNA-directed DNA polymerase [Tanacetum cinerariifolium]
MNGGGIGTEERAEVYYECIEPFKSLIRLWVRSRSIAAIWLEKVVTPSIEPAIKGFAAAPAVLKSERLKIDKTRSVLGKIPSWEHITGSGKTTLEVGMDRTFNSQQDALLLMPKFASTIKSLLAKKDKLFELAKVPLNENCSAMLLKKLPKKLGDLEVTPTQMTLKLADRSITHPKGVAEDVFVKMGKFHFLTDFVVVDFEADPRVPLILERSFLRIGCALIDVYGEEITLGVNEESITFNLNQTMRYSSTYDDNSVNRVDVIDIACEEFVQDILDFQYYPKSCNPTLVSDPESVSWDILFLEKLLNEDPFQLPSMDLKLVEETKEKSSVEEPPVLELKELPSHLEYAFLEDSNKLPVIIANNLKDIEKEALINDDDYKPTVQSQRRVNPKIHDVIKKEVIKLLDAGMIYPISASSWVSLIHCVPKKGGMAIVANENNKLIPTRLVTGYFQIPIDPQDQEKTTFTCPYGTYAYRRMPFGLCNAPGTFQREGIVLGHKISKSGIEIDRANVDVIAKLPHPTTVKGVRSFLCHADLYRRFIQDFSKIAIPMTHLLEKETPFVFSKECVDAFNILKKKLTEAPILVVPDWNLPFKLMCDASDFAIRAVLGKRKTKHFQPIHYASKTMTEAQIHYTMTEKEMLAVVYAFEKFQPYLVLQEAFEILKAYHKGPTRGHRGANLTAKKVFDAGFFWPSKYHDADDMIKTYDTCQRQAIISYRGTHFCNDQFTRVMIKYRVTHRLATAYHPQTSGQVEVSNRGLKRFLERTVGKNRASWSDKLDDALLAFRTAYKTPIGCTPYKLVYGKSCHLLIELEYRAYWALKHAYENSVIYKERTKKFHDSKIKNRIFNLGHQVLLFNSRLKIFSRKLKTRWSGPFTITQVFPYGTLELSQPNGPNFKLNGHRVKHYFRGDIPSNVAPDLHTFLMDN